MKRRRYIEATETEETQVAEINEEVTDTEEVKEESKMSKIKGFVKNHKKGLIIGAVATGLAAVAGVIVSKAGSDDEDDFYDEDDEEFDDPELEELARLEDQSDADEAPATEA